MKTTFLIILLIIVFLFAAETSIQFHPFKVTCAKLPFAIGCILIWIRVAFIQYQSKQDGLKEGANTVMKIIIEESKKPIE